MSTYDEELDHFLNAVDNADYSKVPYEHCYIHNIFSDTLYEELLEKLPSDESYYYMRHPELAEYGKESPRLRLELDNKYVETLPEGHVFRTVAKILHSKELKSLFFKKFKHTLKRDNRLGLKCSPQPCFIRDKKGYKIKPHPDSLRKVITFQIYLPEDNSNEDVGTIVNTKDKPGKSKDSWSVYKQFKFHRNTAYAFPVSKDSWHSVDTLGKDFDRNTMMSIYYNTRPDKSTWSTM